jgi:hypothetical protein
MLRRRPTSISLSNRDINEHLDHINYRKAHERESFEYSQPRRLSGNHADLREDSCSGNGRNRVVTQTLGFSQAIHPERGPVQGDPIERIDLSSIGSSLPGNNVNSKRNVTERLPSRPHGSSFESKRAVVDLYEGTEVKGGNVSISLAENFKRLKDPSTHHRQEHLNDLSLSLQHTFDYGGFVEAPINDLSSLGHSYSLEILKGLHFL